MATSKKDIAVKKAAGAVATADYGEDAGAGYEDQTADDLMVPFLTVLQGLSPQVQDEESSLKSGQLFNTVTEEAVSGKEGVELIPLVTQHVFVEWVPRNRGGGFVAVHEQSSPVVAEARDRSQKFGRYNTSDDPAVGNELVETYYIYAMTCPGGVPGELVLLAFTGTKIKIYKRWNTRIRMYTVPVGDGKRIKPPLFAHRTRVTTSKEKNAEGEFYNFVLSPANGDLDSSRIPSGDALLDAAKALRKQVQDGVVRAAYETSDNGSSEKSASADTPF